MKDAMLRGLTLRSAVAMLPKCALSPFRNSEALQHVNHLFARCHGLCRWPLASVC